MALPDALFSQYERMNSLWAAAEKQLSALHTPVETTVVLETIHSEGEEVLWMIGWIKYRRDWRICLGSMVVGDDQGQWRPILECSAEDRMFAVQGFPALKKKLEDQVPVFLRKITESADELEWLLQSKEPS